MRYRLFVRNPYICLYISHVVNTKVLLVVVGSFLAVLFFFILVLPLFSFTSISPINMVPEHCSVSSEFVCVHTYGSDSLLLIELRSRLQDTASLESFSLSVDDNFVSCDFESSSLTSHQSILISCNLTLFSFEYARLPFTFTYTLEGGSFLREASGEVFIRV